MVEKTFEAKRKQMDTYIAILATIVILVAMADIGINYVWNMIIAPQKSSGPDDDKDND